jgi:hypothetical protein
VNTLTKEQRDFLMAGTDWQALKKLTDKEIEHAVSRDPDWHGISPKTTFRKREIKKIAA